MTSASKINRTAMGMKTHFENSSIMVISKQAIHKSGINDPETEI